LRLPFPRKIRKPSVLLLLGLLVGFHPVLRHGLPRSSEAWSHLENLRRIPSGWDALKFGKMLELFENRQHYTKYPLFYVMGKLLRIDSPFKAAAFSAAVFALLPLLMFFLAGSVLQEQEAFAAGLAVAVTSAFVYTMNFFSGGEPLAVALLLAGLVLHLRRGPIFSLPIYAAIVFLHPFTSLFLWALLLVMPFFLKPDSKRRLIEQCICTGIFSSTFLGWIVLQISRGLPLGDYILSSLKEWVLLTAFVCLTGGSLAVQAMGVRFDQVGRLFDFVSCMMRLHLRTLILVLELGFLGLFVCSGVPGTEQVVQPATALFYLPLLAAIGMVLLRRREVEPFSVTFVASGIGLFMAGTLIVPRAIPAYRLAPYGAMGLSLLLGPCVAHPKGRLVLPMVLAALAATTYPGPSFYFGFDEQYYPAEMAAVSRIPDLTAKACVLSDVRVEDLLRYETGLSAKTAAGELLEVDIGCVVLLNNQMRKHGFYPPGHEWFRRPFKLDVMGLEKGSTTIYDNGWAQILVVTENGVSLGLVSR